MNGASARSSLHIGKSGPSILYIYAEYASGRERPDHCIEAGNSQNMTIVHIGTCVMSLSYQRDSDLLIVFFKFRAEVTDEHKQKFVTELKKLKSLPCVKEQRLVVGGASITNPIERSKGFEFALLSFHEDRVALEEYQKSDEHHQ